MATSDNKPKLVPAYVTNGAPINMVRPLPSTSTTMQRPAEPSGQLGAVVNQIRPMPTSAPKPKAK